MIIDRSHRPWIGFTAIASGGALAAYLIYARRAADGPSGGSWPGLAFGAAGSALMIFAGLLPLRKRLPRWPIGSAQAWLRAHIWLGLLSVPLILFHAGMRLGGGVELALMGCFAAVILSGIWGLAMQAWLPALMKSSVPAQAIFEQVPYVCARLAERGDQLIVSSCGSLLVAAEAPLPATHGSRARPGPAEGEAEADLRLFYLQSVRPYLAAATGSAATGSAATGSAATGSAATGSAATGPRTTAPGARLDVLFSQMRAALPQRLHEALDRLSALCEERRQLHTQVRLQYWLHGWLFLHVPLSMVLLILALAHVVSAVYY